MITLDEYIQPSSHLERDFGRESQNSCPPLILLNLIYI